MKARTLVIILVSIILVSCASSVTTTPTEKPIPADISTLMPLPTSTPFPKPCISLPKTGLPVGNLIKNSHILYQVMRPEQVRDEIALFSVNDNTIRFLDKVEGTSLGFGFLSDGKHFVLRDGDGNARIANIDNSEPIVVPVTKELVDKFSPYSIFWSVLQEGNQEIYPDSFGFDSGRFYSPDGEIVATWKLGDTALVLTDKEKNTSTNIIKTEISDRGVSESITGTWTSDGNQFIFAYNSGVTEEFYTQLYTVNRDGSDLRPLTKRFEKSWISEIKLSPNGEKVLMVGHGMSSLRDVFAILTISTNDLKIFEQGIYLSGSLMPYGSVIWSPDSEWIAFFAHWGQIDIHVLNVENGDTYCVTNDNLIENIMDWHY